VNSIGMISHRITDRCRPEHGDSYHLMRDIKELIDPKGLMNPGKIFI